MSKEELLEGMRDLERREKPGSAAAQLREIEAEINIQLEKGYTQRQIWAALTERGLDLSFSGFKTCLNRMQKAVNELQKVSNGVETCPHCGVTLTDDKAGNQEGEAGALPATNAQPAVATEAARSDVSASDGGMGSVFARRLQSGALNRGLLPRSPMAPTQSVPPSGAANRKK